jgi:hypothetical protein
VADPSVQLCDLATGAVLGQGDVGAAEPRYAAFSTDGRTFALLSRPTRHARPSFVIRLWNVSEARGLVNSRILTPDLPSKSRAVDHLAFSPDGATVAAGTPQEVIYVWDTSTGKIKRRFQGGVAAGFTADGKTLIAVTRDGLLRRFEYPACKLIDPEPAERADYLYVTCVLFAPNGKLVAFSDDWTTLVKEAATGRTVCRVSLPTAAVPHSFSLDGKLLAVTADDGTHFVDTTSGRERAWLPGDKGLAEFLGDGKCLACVGDKALVLRDAAVVLTKGQNAARCADTDPPGVSLRAELLAKQSTYTLDPRVDRPRDRSERIQFDNEYLDGSPDPPQVDLVLRLWNTGAKPLTLRRYPHDRLTLYLVGPGALNHPRALRATGVGGPEPVLQTLAPGACAAIRITDLDGDVRAFWLLPGEYAIAGYCCAEVSPVPKGAADTVDGFGYVTVPFAPVKVKALAGKNAPTDAPAPPAPAIRKPPPAGTVITPEPDNDRKEACRRLRPPIRLHLSKGESLKETLAFLGARYDLEIRIDEAAFQRTRKQNIGETRPTLQLPAHGLSLGGVLHVLADQVDAGVEIRKGAAWIVPLTKPEGLAKSLPRAFKSFRRRVTAESVTLEHGVPKGTTLSAALRTLTDRTELSLFLDAKAFERAGMKNPEKQPVQLAAQKEVPLTSVLQTLLDQVGATFVLRDEIVLVVPKRQG